MKQYAAFSLVELSIVLVILGLLTGGILAGKSLIRASELRSVTTEYTRYVTAAQAFRDKYFYLPGDIINATAIWGPADTAGNSNGMGSDCRVESTTTATCNGDGTGLIETSNSTGVYETSGFWKHLNNAGLIEGNYTGSFASTSGTPICNNSAAYVGGCNVPASKLSKGLWAVVALGSITGHSQLYDGEYGNTFFLASSPTSFGWNETFIAPEDLWNIDTKMDDGSPANGKLVVGRWQLCATGASSVADIANARYNLASTNTCSAFFRRVF